MVPYEEMHQSPISYRMGRELQGRVLPTTEWWCKFIAKIRGTGFIVDAPRRERARIAKRSRYETLQNLISSRVDDALPSASFLLR